VVLQWNGGDPVEATTVVGGAHPIAGSTSLDRFRVFCGWDGGSSEPRSPSLDPHLPFMCAVRHGPTNRIRVGLPRSGSRDKGPIGRWTYWWRSTDSRKQGWLDGANLNRSKLDSFYWLVCVIELLSFLGYLYWARRYVYRNDQRVVDKDNKSPVDCDMDEI